MAWVRSDTRNYAGQSGRILTLYNDSGDVAFGSGYLKRIRLSVRLPNPWLTTLAYVLLSKPTGLDDFPVRKASDEIDAVTEAAGSLLERSDNSSFFLLIHTYEVHDRGRPREETTHTRGVRCYVCRAFPCKAATSGRGGLKG